MPLRVQRCADAVRSGGWRFELVALPDGGALNLLWMSG
jgi:hypothetical protein